MFKNIRIMLVVSLVSRRTTAWRATLSWRNLGSAARPRMPRRLAYASMIRTSYSNKNLASACNLLVLESTVSTTRLFTSSSATTTTTTEPGRNVVLDASSSASTPSAIKGGSPWNNTDTRSEEWTKRRKKNNRSRFRQHVNPLSSKFQQPTTLHDDWPSSAYVDPSLPLHLDIGCGKGGFLVDLARTRDQNEQSDSIKTRLNYLGLEIRPLVAEFAKQRIERLEEHALDWERIPAGRVDVIGCNANVDLERILERYHQYEEGDDAPLLRLESVSIQFPDPHFKTHHAKRRVVTPVLIETLANYMPPKATVFLQSDVESVLLDMRDRFDEATTYFDRQPEPKENLYGVPTEREVSVLNNQLPVYRALFTRNDHNVQS